MADPVFVGMPKRLVSIDIDGRDVEVLEGSTILDACRRLEIDTPTLCQLDNLTPINVCRVCVVELEGSRVALSTRTSRRSSTSGCPTRRVSTAATASASARPGR